MSSIIWMVVRGAMVVMIILVLHALPWPDITPYLVYIQPFVNYTMIANPLVDMQTAFLVVKIVLVIELALLTFKRIVLPVFHFVSSGSFSGGASNLNTEEHT